MEAIVGEHESALLRYAMRFVKDASAAQDVVQDAFIKLFRIRQGGGSDPTLVKSWLYRVVHNGAVDYIRRESRLRLLHERTGRDCPEPAREGATEPMTFDERRELVLTLLDRLHPRERQVVLLRLDQGLSYEEIARATGRTSGNVGNLLHHAVRKLAAALRQAGALEAA
jgi:RNA polymerase sigma-70 factor (ECF subfamily)